MAHEKLAKRYAAAVFSLALEFEAVEVVGSTLRSVENLFAANPDFQKFLLSPTIDRETKKTILNNALQNKIHHVSLHTLFLLVQKRRMALLGEIVTAYEHLIRTSQGRESLKVTSARPLGQHELERLIEKLGTAYGRAFEVHERVDPRQIGGVSIEMADRRIDGSVAGRIDALAASLFSQS